jgi:hypothetical protein
MSEMAMLRQLRMRILTSLLNSIGIPSSVRDG